MTFKSETPVTREALDHWYNELNVGLRGIADLLGCSTSVVVRLMNDYDLPRRPAGRHAAPINRESLDHLYNDLGLDSYEIARRHGCSKTHILRLMEKYGLHRRPPETELRYPRHDFSGDLVEKAYLIGFRAGDLHVRIRTERNSQTIEVGCGTTKQAQVELLHSLFDRYGRVYSHAPTRSGQMHVEAYLNRSFEFLLTKPDRIPDWIRERDECFWAFLAGYTDAEGSIAVYRNRARFVIASYDAGILRDLQAGLVARGVPCPPIRIDQPKGSLTRSLKGTLHRTRGDRYYLGVNRVAALNTLFANLAPNLKHPKRRADMLRAWPFVREDDSI
ncbi:MAG: LAGLIDADG family homing endonuclease [Chloroflexi bacterium]|nr:LAGLIDADG family homing endonuclease [Chloroflexota bacterium]